MEKLKYPPHTTYIEQRVGTPIGYRWLAWADKALVDNNGNIEAIIGGVGRDISERKIAEIDRERSEQRYRHLFNASPVGIILEDVQGGLILDVNQTFCTDYGYEPMILLEEYRFFSAGTKPT